MHVQWYDREKNETGIDLILFNDAYFQRIEKCTTGRVYLLRFTSSDKKMFFWMQEPKEEGDADLIKRFNEATGATIPAKGGSGGGAAAGGTEASQATPPAPVAPGGASQQEQLQQVLQQFLAAQGGAAANRTPPTPLNAVLTTEVLQSLLTDEAACTEMSALLPESHRSQESLRAALVSPQLQQNIHSLSQAIHSDQLPVLLSSLGLDPGAVAAAPATDALEVLCR